MESQRLFSTERFGILWGKYVCSKRYDWGWYGLPLLSSTKEIVSIELLEQACKLWHREAIIQYIPMGFDVSEKPDTILLDIYTKQIKEDSSTYIVREINAVYTDVNQQICN